MASIYQKPIKNSPCEPNQPCHLPQTLDFWHRWKPPRCTGDLRCRRLGSPGKYDWMVEREKHCLLRFILGGRARTLRCPKFWGFSKYFVVGKNRLRDKQSNSQGHLYPNVAPARPPLRPLRPRRRKAVWWPRCAPRRRRH